ncbi:MAG: hypothetical protein M1830_006860 [Pleopsidium flavum]|nr:MAG: hypothetical protein M1830_006860 [Pleopsidium flavum]
MTGEEPYPLYNTTYTLHRLSPLYHGAAPLLDDATLADHARRFRDILKGDVLRGVRVGLGDNDEGLERAGSLQGCRWTLLGHERAWAERNGGSGAPEAKGKGVNEVAGVLAVIQYEKNTYTAVMLRESRENGAMMDGGFSHLPLLMTRMPAPLRETFLDYLSSTFDTRPSPIKLSSAFLTSSLEHYLDDLTTGQDRLQFSANMKTIVKDIQVTLALSPPVAPLLKNLDITISQDDILRFLSRGKRIRQQQPATDTALSRKRKLSSLECTDFAQPGPFTAALSHYMDAHLAMSLTHPDISISKIACGAFVLGAEGKVKIFAPENVSELDEEKEELSPGRKAVERFVAGLVGRTMGEKMP